MKSECGFKITRRIISYLFVLFALILCVACTKEESKVNVQLNTQSVVQSQTSLDNTSLGLVPLDADLLLEVMNNQKPFIAESGAETLFKNYKIPDVVDEVPIIAEEYAFIDLDGDGTDELVVKCTTDYGLYIILHYDSSDDNVYGFSLGVRSFISVKTDGTFMASGGAMTNVINKVSFNKSKIHIEEIAVNDDLDKVYKVKGESVSKQDADKYFADWYKRHQPMWLKA